MRPDLMQRGRALLGALALVLLSLLTAQADQNDPFESLPAIAGPTMLTEEMTIWSGVTSPTVAYALGREGERLVVMLHVQTPSASDPAPQVELAVAAARTVQLTTSAASAQHRDRDHWYCFRIDRAKLVSSPADWNQLHLAARVSWMGGFAGAAKQIERFGVSDGRATHAKLPADPNLWQALPLAAYIRSRRDDQRIVLKIDQPMTGKWTVAIDDAAGRRVRSLVAGAIVERGPQVIEWDGADDFGRMVEPGAYTWRSVHHPGIRPVYVMNFANGNEPGLRPRLSNHSHFQAATANSQYVFLAAPITEGGCSMVALDREGQMQMDFDQVHGTGYHGVAIAADDQYFYAVHDGKQQRQRVNKARLWSTDNFISLTRYDLSTARAAGYGKNPYQSLETYVFGPGGEDPNTQQQVSLAGAALLNGHLYIVSRSAQALLNVDIASGEVVGKIPLPQPGAVASDGRQLLAVSGSRIVQVDPTSGTLTPRIEVAGVQPRALTIDERGRVYVADAASQTIQLFNPDGRPAGIILGQPGGAYEGRYIPERMVRPCGLALFAGKLWVTENRTNPKRALAWDLNTRKIVMEKFGNPPYGGPASGMDPANPKLWLGLGCHWELDLKTGAATVRSILQKDAGHWGGLIPLLQSYRWLHQDGRTFLIGSGKAAVISELRPDGSARDLALLAAPHLLLYAMGWQRVESFCEPFEKAFPDAKFEDKYNQNGLRGVGVLWLDHNGDGLPQADEFEIGPRNTSLGKSSWGEIYHDLTLRMPLIRGDGSHAVVTLAPAGFGPHGVPSYPTLAAAVEAAVPFQQEIPSGYNYRNLSVPTLVDRFGNMVFNSDPFMVSYTAKGELRWQYPNRWSDVHGSHKAPLPSIGEMQGCLSFLGKAPLDDQSDVTILNGNHGRFFVVTTDGMYLDEMFRDTRMGGPNDDQHVGGEPFGGSFRKADTDGTYYLQTGGNGFRIYRVTGLDQVVRQQGSFEVQAPTLLALAQRAREAVAAKPTNRQAAAVRIAQALKIDGQGNDWPSAVTAAWDRDGLFNATVRCGYDDANLYLFYDIRDDSPWLNQGKDWTTLFKTGDSVDFQFGADPSAKPSRRQPVAGDQRLLIAPFGAKPLAVLYRYKAPAPGGRNPMEFRTPHHGVTVDDVQQLESAVIAVRPRQGGYAVEVSVPLKDLGLNPAAGPVSADFGALFGDTAGQQISMRSYWSNPFTAIVNDVPSEVSIHPNAWGVLTFGD